MKKTIIIVAVSIIVVAGGFFTWRSYSCSSSGCRQTSSSTVAQTTACGSSCENKNQSASNHDPQMSKVCERTSTAENVNASQVVLQSEVKVVDYTKCPVSGVVFQVTNESRKVTQGDKSAYTCCATCEGIFNSLPEKFTANVN